MKVPAIDTSLGMEVYSTKVEGIGGAIKRSAQHFLVEEILNEKSLDWVNKVDDKHLFPLYRLHKSGIDSSHAIREVEMETGLKVKGAGLKDAKAVTTQYVSSLRKHNGMEHLTTSHCTLELVGFTDKPLSKKNLAGNKFIVSVIEYNSEKLSEKLSKIKDSLQNNSIANFYGYQRFGGSRALTHLVGREIVKRNFKLAVELFLTHPGTNDCSEITEMREACRDSSNYSKILKRLPKEMDLERILLTELAENNQPIAAIRKLPIMIRRFLVHAYQSYLFNKSLSRAIRKGFNITSPTDGDLCFQFNAMKEFVGIKRYENNSKVMQLPVMPLIGYSFRVNNRFSEIALSTMEEEGMTKSDFYVKEIQEVSAEGGFRPLSLIGNDLSYATNEMLKLGFVLYKGCYATVLLRELLKPHDPLSAGF